MPRDSRRPFSAGPIAWLLLAAVMLAGCQTAGKKKSGPPWLNVPSYWMEPGTVVIYMPRTMAAAKATSGDPTYHNWARALLEYADTSALAKSVVDEGRYLSRQVKISPKTVPSSDYSILIVGPAGQGVHVMEPWVDLVDFLKVDDYLLGRATLDSLPKGCEALRLRVPGDSLADEALPTLDGELPDPTLFDETAALDEESTPAEEQENPKPDKAAARKVAKEEKARLKAEEREQARQKKAEEAAREEKERQEKKEAKQRQESEEEAREQAEKQLAAQRKQESEMATAAEREAQKNAKAEEKAAKAAKAARPDENAPTKPAADDKPGKPATPALESKPEPEAPKKPQADTTPKPEPKPEPEQSTPPPAKKKPAGSFKLFD